MADDDWAEWFDRHTTIFGFKFADDLTMVRSWRPFLDGYCLSELMNATSELAKDPPAFREPHISGLLRCLAAGRHRTLAAVARDQERHHDIAVSLRCGVCDSTGWAMVPHSECMVEGEFVPGPGGRKHTCVVACSCAVGRRKLMTFDKAEKKPMTLDEYEFRFGRRWRDLLDEWELQKANERQLRRSAGAIDRQRGPLAKDLAKLGALK